MKKILTILILLTVAFSVFAYSNIGLTYNGTDYVFRTAKDIKNDDKAYFTGYYDACSCLLEHYKLHDIYSVMEKREFPGKDNKPDRDLKNHYVEAFAEFMTNYAEGSIGSFNDVFPLYSLYMKGSMSFENAKEVVELGNTRFYRKNF